MKRQEIYEKSQELAKKMYEEKHPNKKASVWICLRLKKLLLETTKIGKCSKCGTKILFDTANKDLIKWRAKKICEECVFDSEIFESLTPMEKHILKTNILNN